MFKNLRDSLTKTRRSVFGQIVNVLGTGEIDDETWEDLEAILIQADMGVQTSLDLVEAMRARVQRDGIYRTEDLMATLKEEMRAMLVAPPVFELEEPRQLTIVLVVGVNGAGKTTSIGKLARYYRQRGRKVMMAAGDTLRAAAIDQLRVWADRAEVELVAGQPGGDPAATIYDSIRAARARGMDLVLADTAGRLHTKYNLMKEIEKIRAVCRRSVHAAPHEVLLVVDAPTGQNALVQAQKFKESVDVSGVILTKLDGTAKGGMVFSIYRELGVPVRFVGTGESIDDLAPFDAAAFVDALFEEN